MNLSNQVVTRDVVTDHPQESESVSTDDEDDDEEEKSRTHVELRPAT